MAYLTDFDAFGDADFAEGLYDADSEYAEETAAQRRARARAQARAANRARLGQTGRPQGPPAKNVSEAFSRVATNIKKVDLENKVQSDLIGGALKQQGSRIGRIETSTAVGKVWDEVLKNFTLTTDPLLKSLLAVAPIFLLQPEKKGTGLESVLTDARFYTPALIAIIVLLSKNSQQEPIEITFLDKDPIKLAPNAQFTVRALVKDQKGNPMPSRFIFYSSSNQAFATIDSGGTIRAVAAGKLQIEALDVASDKRALLNVTVE